MFVGTDDSGRPKQVSRTVRGTNRDALRAAAELTVAPPAPSDGRTVADALDAWIETHTPTWPASTVRDQTSRASLVNADRLARMPLGRLTVADVDRWHTRLRAAGVGESREGATARPVRTTDVDDCWRCPCSRFSARPDWATTSSPQHRVRGCEHRTQNDPYHVG